jgi:hypothetical protein
MPKVSAYTNEDSNTFCKSAHEELAILLYQIKDPQSFDNYDQLVFIRDKFPES